MSEKRKFRFGAQVYKASTGRQWADMARKVEDLGYSSLLMPDHFTEYLGPLVGLTAAALAAPKLRIGTLVLDNDFRHPVVLAKELATLDLISEGRLELGIGAGWSAEDYQRSGIPFDPPGVRIDRLEEALQIFNGLFADGPFSFSGKHYTVSELEGLPKPVQKPRPPIMIGAGKKRMLGLAAREADIVNISFSMRSGAWDAEASATGTADSTAEKMNWFRQAAASRLEQIELSVPVFYAEVTDHPKEAAERTFPMFRLPGRRGFGLPSLFVGKH